MAYKVPVLADFRTMFPGLAAKVTDDQVNFWLAQAPPLFDYCRWDDLLFLGMLYWTAHSAISSNEDANQSTFDDATTKKVGDIMKSRSDRLIQAQMDDPYQRTYYGQRYVYYQTMVGMGGGAV